MTQPLQSVLQHHVANSHISTHLATQHGNIHAAIPLRSATQDSKSPYYDTQRCTEHLEATPTVRNQSHVKTILPAPAAHPRYLSSPAGATLHGKTQGFVPKLSPKTKPMQHPCSHYNAFCNLTSPTRLSLRTWQHNMATFMQPFHCDCHTAPFIAVSCHLMCSFSQLPSLQSLVI